MKLLSRATCLLALIVFLFTQTRAVGVVDLTDETYESIYGKGQHWFLMYYAPWCGHCKRMKPFFEEASQMKSKLKFGKIDCTVEKDTCSKAGVRGYPTLKILNEYTMTDYKGSRSTQAFKDLSRKVNDGVVTTITPDNLRNFALTKPTGFLLALSEDDARNEALKNAFATVADKYMISPYAFGVTTNDSVIEQAGLHDDQLPALKVFGEDEKEEKILTQIQGTDSIATFVANNQFPFLTELNQDYFRLINGSGKRMGVVAYKASDKSQGDFAAYVRKLSKSGKYPDIVFVTINYDKNARDLEPYNLEEEDLPQLIVVDLPNRQFFKANKESEGHFQDDTYASLVAFVDDVNAGNIAGTSYGPGGLSSYLNSNTLIIGMAIFIAIALVITIIMVCMPDEPKRLDKKGMELKRHPLKAA